MTLRTMLPAAFAALAVCAGCAALESSREQAAEARVQQAADTYSACVMREVEKDAKSPAGAEDIAVAAHGRCWSEWERYRTVARQTFADGASTPEEKQLAADRADAQTRQAELETRRAAMGRVVERAMPVKRTP